MAPTLSRPQTVELEVDRFEVEVGKKINQAQRRSIAKVKQVILEFLSTNSEDLLLRVTRQLFSRVRRGIEAEEESPNRCVRKKKQK